MNYLRFLISCYHVTGYTYFTWQHWRQYVLMRTVFEKHQSFNTLNHKRPWEELFIWLLRLQRLEWAFTVSLLPRHFLFLFFLFLYFPFLFCFSVTKIMIVETYSYHFLTAKRTPWERENDKRLVTWYLPLCINWL